MEYIYILTGFLIISFLYSSVGHGGASGYIALMVILEFTDNSRVLRQHALMLNLAVSALAFYQFWSFGYFRWKIFLPLAIGSIPMAYLGSRMALDGDWYNLLLGVMLLIPAFLFLFPIKGWTQASRKLPVWLAVIIGLVLGLLSGLTGIGGGVLLSPLLLLGKFTGQKETAALSAPFILVNSASGLFGLAHDGLEIDFLIIISLIVVVLGGMLGSYLGAGKFNNVVLKRILGVVLMIAAVKLLFM